MVICDGGGIATTIASLMMNGVCCASLGNTGYAGGCSTYEDEERRKAEQREFLRNSVKVEWQRHRIMEKEEQMEEQRRQEDAQFLAEQRRRLLMETKRRATGTTEGQQREGEEQHYMQRWQRGGDGGRYTATDMDGRVQSAPVSVGARRTLSRHHPSLNRDMQRCPSNTSSLMDQDTDTDDDEFEDVKLT
uniref:Uncharacterized protein n=1 Tax=Grammatophora oceanica TaxID=210454 RepID=A0A7S1Y5X8_9STRA|eukprot:CAMPEP_0194042820 /NCGR_PEP_ID=MMETSP0009_2-20130614/14560_1 /TAXON_ID=210454 /ORGANISM="Grammatophora oceanica, Strain CCMP 410" /LENGTH=189 /DNA_ID=CAMNT_0038686819 /DNA_START=445 /DNA_END=1014 /DNA_ORIENTATION=-